MSTDTGTVTDAELIHEAEVLRDRRVHETDASGYELLSRDLGSLVFERTQDPDPPGLLARMLGSYGPESMQTGYEVQDLLQLAHQRFEIVGEFHDLGSGRWHYRWQDRE
jgi:hypothetical protein